MKNGKTRMNPQAKVGRIQGRGACDMIYKPRACDRFWKAGPSYRLRYLRGIDHADTKALSERVRLCADGSE